jgi:hypothetical protein
MSLRERLIALADDMTAQPALRQVYEQVALDAARMALEDVERKIWERADAVGCNPVALVADCTSYVRALRDGLDK